MFSLNWSENIILASFFSFGDFAGSFFVAFLLSWALLMILAPVRGIENVLVVHLPIHYRSDGRASAHLGTIRSHEILSDS